MILNRMDANLCRLIFALFLATLDIALCLFLGLFHRIFPVLLLLAILSRSFAIFGFVALTSVFVLLSLSFYGEDKVELPFVQYWFVVQPPFTTPWWILAILSCFSKFSPKASVTLDPTSSFSSSNANRAG